MIKDKKLLKLFADEVENHLAEARTALLDFLEIPEEEEHLQKIIRSFHTMKGSAGIIGLNDFSEYLHEAESFFYSLRKGVDEDSKLKAIGVIEALDELIKHFPDEFDTYFDRLKNLIKERTDLESVQKKSEEKNNYDNAPEENKKSDSGKPRELNAFESENITRLKYIYNDLLTFNPGIIKNTDEKFKKQYLATVVQMGDEIKNLSLISFDSLHDKLESIAVYTSSQCSKKVKLNFDSSGVKLDKFVLGKMEESLVHMIRNSVYHGIELPDERKKTGKSEQGLIDISCRQYGDRVTIDIQDDGAGIDLQKVYDKASGEGLTNKKYSELSSDEIINFIFHSGFSTAGSLGEVSGRGIGMDIVKENILELGGFYTIETGKGKGTSFHINIPSSLETIHSIIVKTGYHDLAIPVDIVKSIIKINRNTLQHTDEGVKLFIDDKPYDIFYLSQVYNMTAEIYTEKFGILMKGGNAVFGFQKYITDSVLSTVSLKGPVKKLTGILGFSIKNDGKPVAIVNPLSLLNDGGFNKQISFDEYKNSSGSAPGKRKNILVVDDNNVVRQMYKGILEPEGYDITLGKNGKEGLNLYKSAEPDLVVADIEMPELSGIEMLSEIRNSDEKTPVIMLSSRGESEDIKSGLNAGANAYLVKRYFSKDDFIKKIREFI